MKPSAQTNPRRQPMRLILLALCVCALTLMIGCPTPTPPNDCNGECKETEECVAGQFCLTKCKEGQNRCGSKCYDLKSDKAHCGKCDNKCGDGDKCNDGKCEKGADCADGETDCGGTCVKTDNSNDHCGACDNKCGDGETCKAGKCEKGAACADGETDCNGTCVDTSSNSDHCGKCDNACGTDLTCNNGACECQGGQTKCGDSCVDTDNSDDHCGKCDNKCNSPQYCDVGTCVCPSGQSVCGDKCVSLKNSDDHCGKCDNKCPSGTACSEGSCVCDKGTKCGEKCVETDTDAENCGACGNKCAAGEVCKAGQCEGGSCKSNETDCAGTCVDTQTDAKHCGSCGKACAAGESCDAGACKAGCASPKTDCAGSCVDTQTDAKHCGSCGKACAAGETCDAGACKAGCKSNETDCNGTCVDTQTDAKHCGSCGNACAAGETCGTGTCKAACVAPKKDCMGTCTDTDTDTNNCGSCGNKCASGETCVSGACQTPCPAGQTDCSGTCVNTYTDANNCGACGTKCATGKVCVNGKCGDTWANVYTTSKDTIISRIAANKTGAVYAVGRQLNSSGRDRFFMQRIAANGTKTNLTQEYSAPYGFNADLNQAQSIRNLSTHIVKGWRTSSQKGLFDLGNKLNDSTGEFVAPRAGYYLFSARITFANANRQTSGHYIRTWISLNGNGNHRTGCLVQIALPTLTTHTMSPTCVLKVKQNDKITVRIRSTKDSNYSISSQSGFSGIYLGPQLAEGFHVAHGDTTITNTNSNTLKSWNTDQTGTFINGTGFNKTTGVYTAPSAGKYYFSANVLAGNLADKSSIIAQLATTSTGISGRNGRYARVNQNGHVFRTLYTSGVVSLAKGDTIRLMVESSDNNYTISSATGFSGFRLPDSAALFNVSSLSSTTISGIGWKQIKPNRTDLKGQTRGGVMSSGTFTVPVTGYYALQAQVLFNNANFASGEGRLTFAVNGNKYVEHGAATYTKGGNAATNYTLSANTIIQLNSNDKVTLWVYSSIDNNYSIGPSSHFSGALVGVSNSTFRANAVTTDDNDHAYVAGTIRGLVSHGGKTYNILQKSARSYITQRKSDGSWTPLTLLGTGSTTHITNDNKGNVITCGDITETWTYRTTGGAKKITPTGTDSHLTKLKAGASEATWSLHIDRGDNNGAAIKCSPTSTGGAYALTRHKTSAKFAGTTVPGEGTNWFRILSKTKDDGSGFDWTLKIKGDNASGGLIVDKNDTAYFISKFTQNASVGTTALTSAGDALYVAAVDKTGKVLWATKGELSGSNKQLEVTNQLAVASNGLVYVGGYFTGTLKMGTTTLTATNDMFIAALDDKGNWLWAKKFGGPRVEASLRITIDPSDNLYTSFAFKSSVITIGGKTINRGNSTDAYASAVLKNLP